MSGRGSGGGPSRGAGGPTQTTWARDGVGAILVVLAVGLAFRLLIVKVYGGTGLEFDLGSFWGWADNLASQGLNGFYQRDFFHDYTPGYLYVLYAVGLLSQAISGGAGHIGDMIKLPPILADVAIGWLVWSMAIEIGASRRAALVGAAIAVANPISWFDSVTWGQVDSFGVVFLLLGLRELWRDRPERAAIWTVIAALIKPQLGILIPLVAVVTIRRALRPTGGFGRLDPLATDRPNPNPAHAGDRTSATEQGGGALARIRAWERRTDYPIRILTTGLAGFLTAVILCAPFGLSVIEVGGTGGLLHSGLMEQVFKTTGEYPYVSVNAYNPWALAELNGHGLARDGTWVCDAVLPPVPNGPVCDAAVQFGPVPAVAVGAALLLAVFAVVCIVVVRRPDRLTLLLGLTVLAIAFFVVPTRVHERYMFPFIALGAILAGVSWRWLVAYIVLSLATFLNMYVVLTSIYGQRSGTVDWLGMDPAIRSSTGVTIIAVAVLAAGAWAFAQLRPGRRTALADEIEAEADGWTDAARFEPRPDSAAASRTVGGAALMPASRAPGALPWEPGDLPGYSLSRRVAAAPISTSVAPLPAWSERPSFSEAGAWAWFRSRLFDRPVRADRSGELVGEPGGRLDRLDAWFVVVLVVAILGLRIFRLAEPYEMHFDEVYHARTATEFLQDWRYGISHDIYEWTHPHLAKYIMAGGLVAWGEDRVSGTSDLGVPVRDALVEPRRDDPKLPDSRAGDRLHVVTGSELRSYDLQTRRLIATTPIAGAEALAVDPVLDRVYVATAGGEIVTVDQSPLDTLRSGGVASPAAPVAFATADGPIVQLYATDDGGTLFVATADGKLETFLASTGERVGSVPLPGIAGFAPVGSGPAVTASAGSVEDPSAVATTLASILGGEAATYKDRLASSADQIVLGGIVGAQQRADVLAAIKDGRLAGLAVEDVPRVAVAAADGVDFVDPGTGEVISTTPLDGGAHGIAAISGVDDPKLYATTGGSTSGSPGGVAVIVTGGTPAKDGPTVQQTIALPGAGTRVAFDDASEMVHVLGATPDDEGQTIYVIEPHGNAVFADARLPFTPVALAVDVAKLYPSADRQQILAFDASGELATVELGKHAFAWRLPGVIAGALMAGLLYLLTRILFRRRTIALLVGVMAIADGMFFVQSRIGMNDAYVGLGIVAAYTLFAALWTGAWRWRGAFWLAMPVIGFLLGLALASKWVALYAIGALGLLILARSALGRLIVLGGLIVMTAVLGHIAIAVPAGGGFGNLPFVAIMIGLTAVAAAVIVLHPIAWSDDEIRFAVGAPAALGVVVGLAAVALGKAGATIVIGPLAVTPLYLAAGLVVLSLVVYGAFFAAGRLGLGPLAPPPAPNDPASLLSRPSAPPEASWLRPGALLGLPIVWMVACLLLLPIALYVASYLPWAFIENHRITDTWPPGHTGQTLVDLTIQMYNYHNNLTAGHAASSPWWAWPFDLKPVWFYQGGFAGSTAASIYDAGNLAIWWLGVPAMAFVGWQAYARRSLALALVGIGFAFQWVSWARIDRAAFQYHYYTSLPFIIIGLAYLLAEVWHGASRRTWLLVRLAAAAAIMGPALMWLFDRPLCGFVGVERANPGSQACPPLIPQFVLTAQTLGLAVVICVAVVFFLRQLSTLDRAEPGERAIRQLAPLGATAVGALVGLFVVRLLPIDPVLTLDRIPVEPVAIVLGLPLFLLALYVATARDARRFVIGAMVAIVGWFVVVYPNISALPLPAAIASAYQGILPTYLYAFQFPVNTVARPVVKLFDPVTAILAGAVLLFCIVIAYWAWIWRHGALDRYEGEDEVTSDGLAPRPPGP